MGSSEEPESADTLASAQDDQTNLLNRKLSSTPEFLELQKSLRHSVESTIHWKKAALTLESSSSFRMGRRLIKVFEKPSSIFSAFQDLIRIFSSRSQSSMPQFIPEEFILIYFASGLERTIAAIESHYSEKPGKEMADRYLSLANDFRDLGILDVAFSLSQTAWQADSSASTAFALYSIARDSHQLDTSLEMIKTYPSLLPPTPTRKEQAQLRKISTDPINQLASRALLPDRRVRPIGGFVAGRICYALHNSLPHSSGGYATRAHGLAKALNAARYEVVCITRPGYPVDLPGQTRSAVRSVDEIDGISYLRVFDPKRKDFKFNEYVPKAAASFEEQFSLARPEFVICASNYIVAFPALIAARRLGIPFIYEVRGFWEVTRASREPPYRFTVNYEVQAKMEAFVAENADMVATLTGAMKNELIDRGADGKKIHIVPNACDPDQFNSAMTDSREAKQKLGISPDTCVIGYVGTFVDYEGLPELLKACANLQADEVNFHLLIVGNDNTSNNQPGPIYNELLKLAATAQLEEQLTMPGRVPHSSVRDYYAAIDVAVFPRRPWPVCEMVSPMKPLEALSMGKAVVVSSVHALRELISDKVTGLVFEKGSVGDLEFCLNSLISDPQLRAELGKNGREWVIKERTWRNVAQKFATLLDSISKHSP